MWNLSNLDTYVISLWFKSWHSLIYMDCGQVQLATTRWNEGGHRLHLAAYLSQPLYLVVKFGIGSQQGLISQSSNRGNKSLHNFCQNQHSFSTPWTTYWQELSRCYDPHNFFFSFSVMLVKPEPRTRHLFSWPPSMRYHNNNRNTQAEEEARNSPLSRGGVTLQHSASRRSTHKYILHSPPVQLAEDSMAHNLLMDWPIISMA